MNQGSPEKIPRVSSFLIPRKNKSEFSREKKENVFRINNLFDLN